MLVWLFYGVAAECRKSASFWVAICKSQKLRRRGKMKRIRKNGNFEDKFNFVLLNLSKNFQYFRSIGAARPKIVIFNFAKNLLNIDDATIPQIDEFWRKWTKTQNSQITSDFCDLAISQIAGKYFFPSYTRVKLTILSFIPKSEP